MGLCSVDGSEVDARFTICRSGTNYDTPAHLTDCESARETTNLGESDLCNSVPTLKHGMVLKTERKALGAAFEVEPSVGFDVEPEDRH